ncbi:MAG: DUF192 domain-containing protein [Verrucomicrobiae bacterium]|nr:DUF192 domain-containing protein [Verrucomicrobiae bacterium]
MSRNLSAQIPYLRLILVALIGTILPIGCAENKSPEPLPLERWQEVVIEGKTIEIQIAFLEHEMKQGLMNRSSMGENRGMLFFYDPPKQMSFWMHNTHIPLDIGYFTADGILREVYPMYPMDERSVKSRRKDLLMALEMNQGWYAKNGIKPGDSFDVDSLKKALLNRGIPESRIPF